VKQAVRPAGDSPGRPGTLLVIGQGYVGLPLALAAVDAGFDVVGFDTDDARVKRLSAGSSYVEDVSDEALARALATGPRLILLDEVAGGLTDPEVAQLVEIVREIQGDGIAVVWIEHVLRALTAAVDRLICLAGGSFVADGEPGEVLANPAVREIFLGSEVTTSLVPPGPEAAGGEAG